jgi:AraC-like DNA-binding protein
LVHDSFERPVTVATMAEVACMSQSAFHHAFKEVTTISPLQYVKQIRLHEARRLLVMEGASATETAGRVGYSSPSQFSREFKRLFGVPPSRANETVPAEARAS